MPSLILHLARVSHLASPHSASRSRIPSRLTTLPLSAI